MISVTIPNSVTRIGGSAFYGCSSLTGVYFRGNAPGRGGHEQWFGADQAVMYYLPGATGWGTTFRGRPTALWLPRMEAATHLASPVWLPLQTNTLASDSLDFHDADWAGHPARFYRVRTAD